MTIKEDISDNDLRQLLDSEAARINSPAFIADDPVQFARRYERPADIEIASLLVSTIAWGNRKMICRNADKMLAMMNNRPYDFVMDQAYEQLPDGNIHRTFFVENLRRYLRGLYPIYARYGSLQEFARALHIADYEQPSWRLVEGINDCIAQANNGKGDSRCLPLNLDTTALKRVNMALRWLVRRDGIVDLGIWDVITPAQLFIPLDVHVANVARQLGLLERRSNDRKAVVQLTSRLAQYRPDDPVIYDYALFGIGAGI
jgi:uncharacterized protein (TIGR02757 family)